MKKAVAYFILFFLALVFLIFSYLWGSYIDEKTISGEAYGFSIGDSKLDTYRKASGMLSHLDVGGSPIFISITIDEHGSSLVGTKQGYTVLSQTLLHEVGFSIFKNKEKWDFYFNGTYFDSLSLKFCDNKLCEIYRHKKNFELP